MTSVYQALATVEEQNQAGVLCTIINSQGSTPRHTTSKMFVYPDGTIVGTIGGGEMERRVIDEALAALHDKQPRKLAYQMNDPARGDPGVCGGQVEIFVEPVLPKPTLLLIGAGHVGKAVAYLADWLGFQVVVSDDRSEFCNPQAVPGGKIFLPVPLKEIPSRYAITPWTYIVLTTRGSNVDVVGLPALLESSAAYIGVIGSRRRWETTRRELIAAGISTEKLDLVHSPIGIELNAETPEEIAVSIMAEVLMVLHSGSGKTMSASISQTGQK